MAGLPARRMPQWETGRSGTGSYFDRDRDPADTVARLWPYLPQLGITRLARQTGLDRVDEAVVHLEDAADRGPNHADVLMTYADGLVHAGVMPKAKVTMDHALELNPLAPDLYYWIAGTADFFLGNYADASLKLSTMRESQSAARFIAAVEAMNGNLQRAHEFRDTYLAQHPDFRIADYHIPLRKKGHREQYLEALRRAGFH